MIIIGCICLVILLLAVQIAWIKLNGTAVSVPEVNRTKQTIGSGKPLTYAVLGDSTAVSQGGNYAQGYATATANYLAKTYRVSWINLAVSGARARDVAGRQVAQAAVYKPDVVLVAVGANDVTHVTGLKSVRNSLQDIIHTLRQTNPKVRILLTGSPDMGAPPRIPQPLRMLAGARTTALNKMVVALAGKEHVTFVPIAEKTGPIYRAHHELFAADNFHPTTEGYKLWIPVITAALDAALR